MPNTTFLRSEPTRRAAQYGVMIFQGWSMSLFQA
jgi:hypothetical protein